MSPRRLPAAALPPISERQFQAQIASASARTPGLATLLGWRSWHDQATNAPRACPTCHAPLSLPRNDPGWPDLFLLRGDTLIVAELKSDAGTVSDEQRSWLDAFRAVRRIMVAVWKPKHWPEIERILR